MSQINSLHVVPSRDHVVMAFAFINEYSIPNAEILYFGGDKLESYFHSLASDLGVKFVDLSETENRFYDELYVQSWFAGVETSSIIKQIKFNHFFLYSEGHGNNFYSLLIPTDKLNGLVFLGFEMKESAFNDNLGNNLALKNRIIAYSTISRIYSKLFHIFSAYSPNDCLNEKDLLIVSRYWGMPVIYPFAKSVNVEYEIAEELCQAKEISRVVIRSDSRYSLQNSIDLLKLR